MVADRTNHIQVTTNSNVTLLANGTYGGGQVQHIGQIIEAVEITFPYNLNTSNVTSNAIDLLTPTAASKEYDPFMKYAFVGRTLSTKIAFPQSHSFPLAPNNRPAGRLKCHSHEI